VVDSGEVGRSAVYSRYNNSPRTLPWDTPALTDDSSVYSVSTFICYFQYEYENSCATAPYVYQYSASILSCEPLSWDVVQSHKNDLIVSKRAYRYNICGYLCLDKY
jgi:hypothetical protein